jgi:hypothetical protein
MDWLPNPRWYWLWRRLTTGSSRPRNPTDMTNHKRGQGIISVQAAMNSEELTSGIAFVVFSQAFGPTIAMTLYNVIFLESIKKQIPRLAPNVRPLDIVNAGATGFRSFVPREDLQGVLQAYSDSIDRTFYLAAAFAALCGLFLWGMGWHDLREKKKGQGEEEEVAKEGGGGEDVEQTGGKAEKVA